MGIAPGVFVTPRLPFLPGLPKALSQPLGATAVTAVGWAHPSLSGAAPRLLVDVSPEFTVCGQAHISLQTFSAGSMGSSAGGGVRRGWSDSPPSLAISWLCGKPLEQGPKPRRVSEAHHIYINYRLGRKTSYRGASYVLNLQREIPKCF